jgi:hypothetical protein
MILNKKKRIFYCHKSVLLKLFERIFPVKQSDLKIEKVDFHLIEYTTGIRKRAYDNAYQYLNKIDISSWTTRIARLFLIDFELICKKFFFDELYVKYEFIEIAKKYKKDFPNETCSIIIKRKYAEPYSDQLTEFEKVTLEKEFSFIFSLTGILLIPFVLCYYYYKNKSNHSVFYKDQIVCLVDDHSTYRMFNDIFLNHQNLSFIIEKHNISSFTHDEIVEFNLNVLGLTRQSFIESRRLTWKYIKISLCFLNTIGRHGMAAFDLFYLLLKSKGETINGSGNMFVTYEHLITVKAARNEFLSLNNNISVFIPKNAYTAIQYFHSEIFINYTIMCSAGQHTIDLLQKKMAKTKIFLPAGSYDNHRGIVDKPNQLDRLNAVANFKKDNKLVTIISPGICDPTFQHEIKLLELAKEIAKIPGIKVLIRTKPVQPILKYADFYEKSVAGVSNILLTNKEFELFDFLTHTDLFVTSVSNAASDVALAGGNVMFINFIKDRDFFLFWEKVPEILVEEEDALSKIKSFLLSDRENNGIEVKESSAELIRYLGYSFKDFSDYRNNLLQQLLPYIPKN